jgi:hypothetical protein
MAQEPPLPTAPLASLEVLPSRVELVGSRAMQHLVVLGTYANGQQRDLTRQAQFSLQADKIAVMQDGSLIPLADGTTQLTATAAGKTVQVPVAVKQFRQEMPLDFHTEIIPLLNKQGCNQGACHGAQHGKGGFRLSLFGFDPDFDYEQIVKSAKGRRVVLSDPERSILLLKPSLAMEHGGGERLKANSAPYQMLKQWLEEGAPPPGANPPKVTQLTVLPPQRLMQPGEKQQLVVLATWSDGRTVDVTATAQYDALNDSIAGITPDGLTQCKKAGETAIMIRYCGQANIFAVTSPYAKLTAKLDFPENNFIDKHLAAKWKNLGLQPSPLSSDEQFLRRVYLDAIGTLPTPEEIRSFRADNDPQKRAKVIDRLLERPEFIDFWTLKWGDLLRINRDALEAKGMWSFHQWIRSALRDNVPVDAFVRDIITAEGSTYREGPANFYRIGNTAEDWAETTSQVFLGVRMQCAKCHHHPFEKWSQEDYYGMTAYFVRMGRKNSQEFGLFGRETVVFLRPNGEARHPRKGTIVKPHPLDGEESDDPFDRRRKLADWITAKENPLFARNIVNRFWGYFMGRGLVEPLDDLRATNPATNPELLDALAADFVQHNYSLKHLVRTILNSRAYQLGSAIMPGNAADSENHFHTRYQVKRLTAEQMADALDDATGTREKYPGLPLGTRAIQLPDTQVRSYLMDVFGRPARQITCECERTMTPNIAQALHLVNGDFLNAKISRPGGRLDRLFREKTPLPQIVEELYLVTLSRSPRTEEVSSALKMIAQAPNPRQGTEDLLWALVNSRGFLFNH